LPFNPPKPEPANKEKPFALIFNCGNGAGNQIDDKEEVRDHEGEDKVLRDVKYINKTKNIDTKRAPETNEKKHPAHK